MDELKEIVARVAGQAWEHGAYPAGPKAGAQLVTARCLASPTFTPPPGARLTPLAEEEAWRRRREAAPRERGQLEALLLDAARQLLAQGLDAPRGAEGACTTLALEVCSDAVTRMVGAGACRVGLCSREVSDLGRLGKLAAYIDHTLLRPDATRAEIDELCAQALEHRFATVCVNGAWVRRCAEILAGSGILVCAVIGFPLGASVTEVKVYEARRAIEDGACEVDMVLNVGALRSSDDELVRRDIAAVAQACHRGGAKLKVILETCLLTDAEKVRACQLSQRAGADFVKTSTGFSKAGATVEDVALMRRTVGPGMGVKASGGVRDEGTARAMLAAGATRLGTSASVALAGERG